MGEGYRLALFAPDVVMAAVLAKVVLVAIAFSTKEVELVEFACPEASVTNTVMVLEADTGPIGNNVIVRLSPEPPKTILAGVSGTSAVLLDFAQTCSVLVETSTLPTVKAILVVWLPTEPG